MPWALALHAYCNALLDPKKVVSDQAGDFPALPLGPNRNETRFVVGPERHIIPEINLGIGEPIKLHGPYSPLLHYLSTQFPEPDSPLATSFDKPIGA
jgi:hypothetical protein